MSLESGDLISLLKRARQSAAAATAAAAPTPAPVPAAPAAVAVEAPPSDPEPAPEPRHAPVPPKIVDLAAEADELASLHADLYADEIFIQRILGLLYRCKRQNPNGGFISILEMERILGVEREGATFVMAYMKSHRLMEMDDKSRMAITVPGIDYLRRVLGIHNGPSQTNQPPEPEE